MEHPVMLKRIILLATAFVAGQAVATPTSPLIGMWVEVNGTGMARIGPCSTSVDRLCATGIARRSGTLLETGLVMSDIRTSGANRWRGTYLDNGRSLPATLKRVGERHIELKVCIFVLCQSATYERG
jgi:uncharacterized protein (DUF2147 family)